MASRALWNVRSCRAGVWASSPTLSLQTLAGPRASPCARQPEGPMPSPDRGTVKQCVCSPGAPCGQCPEQMDVAGPPPATTVPVRSRARKAFRWSFPGLGVIRLKHARVVLSLSLKHTLLSFLMKSKCPRCPLKPSGGPAPCLRGFPLLGSCVQRVSVSSGVCLFACRPGVCPAECPNEYSLLESHQK